jgi:anhydro-N-acetylmuramic acid kinase
MVYRVIGLMSGSSLDGLDIAYVHLHENASKWNFEIIHAACYAYNELWKKKLQQATSLNARDYQLLHIEYGHYTGKQVNHFINENNLHFQVQLIASHGHTTFHEPQKKMTAQLGDGAAIAAETGINVVSDLRSMDVALGGQGAPIVPIGEKLLFTGVDLFLNLGGIANISQKNNDGFIGFDICPVNRVLNMLANEAGKDFDKGGEMAASGKVNLELLDTLNSLEYYGNAYPKSLANNFGTEIIFPIIKNAAIPVEDGLRTYIEHITQQIKFAIEKLQKDDQDFTEKNQKPETRNQKLLVTGGGALNTFLIERLKTVLGELNIQTIPPAENIIQYKEALVMALIGVLRWREEINVLSSVTGSLRNSIGGAVWIGQEA